MSDTTPIRTAGITVTEHNRDEWLRLSIDAYRIGLNDTGHRFAMAAARRAGYVMTTAAYDSLQAEYREWLIGGFPGFPLETLQVRGL